MKTKRFFLMFDKNNNLIGRGSYYPYGGNIQMLWYKYQPEAGNIQFHSLSEALLSSYVAKVEWEN